MKQILAIGLNPAYQRTMVFDQVTIGEVNRATLDIQCPGGKAILFSRAAHRLYPGSALPAYFAGGVSGQHIVTGLKAMGIESLVLPTDVETRTCTTVIDAHNRTSTELIGCMEPIAGADIEQMRQLLLDAASRADALAFCGTFPAGVNDSMFLELIEDNACKPILLDACRGVEALLNTGKVSHLNINISEGRILTGKSEAVEIAARCNKLFNINYVMLTDGPGNAHLFTSTTHHEFSLECIDYVNPIGAGDTCSGVTFAAIINGEPIEEAFSKGLAAASASCLQLEPAAFSLEDMHKMASGMTIRSTSRA